MPLAAILGLSLFRRRPKRQKLHLPKGDKSNSRQDASAHEPERKGGPTVLSLGTELLVAVAISLLRRYMKSWGSQMLAAVKESRVEPLMSAHEKSPAVTTDAAELRGMSTAANRGTPNYYQKNIW